MSKIRLFGVVNDSIVDGPGLRLAVFVQGCPFDCPGCHNPQSRDFNGGYESSVVELLEQLDKNPLIKGITLSGGEPFCQAVRLVPLAKEVRRRGKDIWCFSGYTFEELLDMSVSDSGVHELLSLLDVLVDGRFDFTARTLALPYRGSGNQRILDVPLSLEQAAPVEHIIN